MLWLLGRIKVKFNNSLLATSSQNFIYRDTECKLLISMRSSWLQKLVLMLCWVAMWSAMNHNLEHQRFSHEPVVDCVSCWKKEHFGYRPTTIERKPTSVQGCILDSIQMFLTWYCLKSRKGCCWIDSCYCSIELGAQRSYQTCKWFNLSKEDDFGQYTVIKHSYKNHKYHVCDFL